MDITDPFPYPVNGHRRRYLQGWPHIPSPTTRPGEELCVLGVRNYAIGKWENKYQGNADLAGIRVQQFPDCFEQAHLYEGKHPTMILYVFKDARVNKVTYNPDGTVDEDLWFSIGPDSCLWTTIDRSYAIPSPSTTGPTGE